MQSEGTEQQSFSTANGINSPKPSLDRSYHFEGHKNVITSTTESNLLLILSFSIFDDNKVFYSILLLAELFAHLFFSINIHIFDLLP